MTAYIRALPLPDKRDPVRLTLVDIRETVAAMPCGIDGFMKGWGWQQFARAIETAVLAANGPGTKVENAK